MTSVIVLLMLFLIISCLHLCVRVERIEDTMRELRAKGVFSNAKGDSQSTGK